MQLLNDKATTISTERMTKVALKTYFSIMAKWHVNTKQAMVILGCPAQSTFYKWKNGNVTSIPKDTLERISFVIGIYKSLGILFSFRQQADEWVNKPNEAFNGETAIEFMLKGSIINLLETRRYLDAQRG